MKVQQSFDGGGGYSDGDSGGAPIAMAVDSDSAGACPAARQGKPSKRGERQQPTLTQKVREISMQ